MKKTLLLVTLLSIFASSAMAAEEYKGYYAGIKLLDAHSTMKGGDVGGSAFDQNAAAGGIFGGYRFNDKWAIEGGYDYLGQHDFNLPTGSGNVKLDSLHVEAVGFYPVYKGVEVFGKLGASYSYTKANETFGLTNNTIEARSFGVVFGGGATYWIDKNVELRAEMSRTSHLGLNANNNISGSVDTVGLSSAWHF